MKTTAVNWDNIPSLEELTVDWDYEPDDSLGKRKWSRIETKDLHSSFEVENIPVKVVTKNINKIGRLVDLSIGGLAILFDINLVVRQPTRIGLYLGKHMITARTIVRNASSTRGKFRIGMEFVELEDEHVSFITSVIASKIHTI